MQTHMKFDGRRRELASVEAVARVVRISLVMVSRSFVIPTLFRKVANVGVDRLTCLDFRWLCFGKFVIW